MISVDKRFSRLAKTGLNKASFLFVVVVFGALLSACERAPQKLSFSGSTMGTGYHLTVISDQPIPDDLQEAVDAILDSVDSSMSTYKAESELNQLNRQPLGKGMQLSEPLWQVMSVSSQIYVLSGASFDPSMGRLVDLWGFGPTLGEDRVPEEEEIAQAMANSGLQFLEFGAQRTVTRHRDIRLDLSAVAKGYAVDLVANYLEDNALSNYLVEVGGEMRVSGNNSQGVPWRVAIESPGMAGGVERIISLQEVAIATSGDYRNYFEKDGVRYSHTIDPRNGRPIDHNLASVTVISQRCATADALATAFSVMGAEESLQLANREGIAAYFLVKQQGGFIARYSEAFAPYMDKTEEQ